MAVTNRGNHPDQFDKDFNEIFLDRYMANPAEHTQVAKIIKMDKGRYYKLGEISGIGSLLSIDEGGRVQFDTPVEGHDKSVEMDKYGLGVQFTEEMFDDAIHTRQENIAQTLADAGRDIYDTNYFNLFNNGFTSETAWDGEYVFDGDHTTLKSGDTIDNDADAALSETSLRAAFEYFDDLVDEAGRPINVTPDLLIVPTNLRWTAHQLLKQMGGVSTAGAAPDLSGNMMLTNPENGAVGAWTYMVSKYVTDDYWFFVSKKDHMAYMIMRKNLTLESESDFETGNRLYKITTRFKPTVFDYKPMYGSDGS